MIHAPRLAATINQMICCSQRSRIGLPLTGMRLGGTSCPVAVTMAPSRRRLPRIRSLPRYAARALDPGNWTRTKTQDRRTSVSTHIRIRPFNTRDTYPEQNLDNDLCQAVVAGDTIYLRGQIGQNLDTSENVGVGDVTAQAEQAMTNIDLLLREAGSSLQDIVKVTVYLVDPRYREQVYRVMGRWLTGVYPVSTGLVVSALARPEWLVEIDAIAVRSAAS